MKHLLFVLGLLVLTLALAGCGGEGEVEEGEVTEEVGEAYGEAEQEVQGAYQETEQEFALDEQTQVSYAQRQEFMSDMDRNLQQTGQMLEQFEQQIMQMPPERRDELMDKLGDIREARAERIQQFNQLRTVGEEEWEDQFTDFRDDYMEFRQRIQDLRQQMMQGQGH